MAFTPWFRYQSVYLVSHQDCAERRVAAQHPHFFERAVGNELSPFFPY
jgi:hypothetical protein